MLDVTPVCIVGGGPVGMTLAIDLASPVPKIHAELEQQGVDLAILIPL